MAKIVENSFTVHHKYLLCASFVFWIMGWLCIYMVGSEMYSYVDDILSRLFYFFMLFLLVFGGPFFTIFLYSWKIEIKGDRLIIEKYFGKIRREYLINQDLRDKVELKSNGTVKIEFDDKFIVSVDTLAVGYKKLKKCLYEK